MAGEETAILHRLANVSTLAGWNQCGMTPSLRCIQSQKGEKPGNSSKLTVALSEHAFIRCKTVKNLLNNLPPEISEIHVELSLKQFAALRFVCQHFCQITPLALKQNSLKHPPVSMGTLSLSYWPNEPLWETRGLELCVWSFSFS